MPKHGGEHVYRFTRAQLLEKLTAKLCGLCSMWFGGGKLHSVVLMSLPRFVLKTIGGDGDQTRVSEACKTRSRFLSLSPLVIKMLP